MEHNLGIENLIKILEKFFSKSKEEGVLFCYLFGSFAYQNFNSKSDVDIAVFLDKEKNEDFFKTRLELIANLSRLLKREADVVILNNAKSILFKYAILREGKLVFAKDAERMVDFEMKVLRDYYDFLPFSKEYNKAYIERCLNE